MRVDELAASDRKLAVDPLRESLCTIGLQLRLPMLMSEKVFEVFRNIDISHPS